jgi:ATP-binding cassette, subfamily C (CFTR/MRP), member 1
LTLVAGLGLLLVVLPAQYALGALAARTRKSVVGASDARVQLMDEVLRAIKLVKCYGWEESFASLVASFRSRETGLLAKSSIIKSMNLSLVFVLPPLIALAIVSHF